MAIYRVLKGLDLPLAGAPEQVIEPAAPAAAVALLAEDYVGLKPAFRAAFEEIPSLYYFEGD